MEKRVVLFFSVLIATVVLIMLFTNSSIYPPVKDSKDYSKTMDLIEDMNIEKIIYPEDSSGLSLKLNIENNKFTLLEQEIVNGFPDYLPGTYPFMARVYSSNEDLLGEYGFNDPRIILGEQGYTGPKWLENVNFTLIIPYFNDSKLMNIYSERKLLLSVNVDKVNK